MSLFKAFCYSALFLLITSCNHVYFTEIQPKDGVKMKIIPSDIHGFWNDEYGSIQIHGTGFTDTEYNLDSNDVFIDSTSQTFNLSDSFMLFKAEDMYVFNVKYKSDYWEIVVLSKQENGDLHYYDASSYPEAFENDSNLSLVEAKYTIDDEDKIVHELDPEFDSNLSFQYAIFSGQMSINTLREVMNPEYLQTVYKVDGTLFSPADTISYN